MSLLYKYEIIHFFKVSAARRTSPNNNVAFIPKWHEGKPEVGVVNKIIHSSAQPKKKFVIRNEKKRKMNKNYSSTLQKICTFIFTLPLSSKNPSSLVTVAVFRWQSAMLSYLCTHAHYNIYFLSLANLRTYS